MIPGPSPSVRGTGRSPSASAPHLVGDLARERGETGGNARRLLLGAPRLGRVFDQLDVEAQRLKLLEEHVERLRQAGFEHVLALDDRLVHPGATEDVVGLDRQELLQRVRRTVGFHRPDFHLAEALTAELRLAAQRLLGDERVRADRPRVDLVVDEVVQLEHVHHADGDHVVERLAALAIDQPRLADDRQAGHLERALDLVLGGAVEHRSRTADRGRQRPREPPDVVLVELVDDRRVLREQLLELLAHDVGGPMRLEVRVDLVAQLLRRPPEMHLEDLADVHAARHAERIEHDVDRRAVLEVRHVLLGEQPRYDALVAVAAGHLVADGELALDREVDLDELDHAGRQLVALGELRDLLRVLRLDVEDVFLALGGELLELLFDLAVAAVELDLVPVAVRGLVEHLERDLLALGQKDLALVVDEARRRRLTDQELAHLVVVGLRDDLHLVALVEHEELFFGVLDRLRALVLLGALACEYAGADHHADHTRRYAQ